MSRISDISINPQICPGTRVHDSSEDSGIIQAADTEPLINNSSEPPMDEWQDVNNSRYGSIQHVASYQSISAEYERTEDAEGVYLGILESSKMIFVKISRDFIKPPLKFLVYLTDFNQHFMTGTTLYLYPVCLEVRSHISRLHESIEIRTHTWIILVESPLMCMGKALSFQLYLLTLILPFEKSNPVQKLVFARSHLIIPL